MLSQAINRLNVCVAAQLLPLLGTSGVCSSGCSLLASSLTLNDERQAGRSDERLLSPPATSAAKVAQRFFVKTFMLTPGFFPSLFY